jgi:hypothetical protein
MAGELADKEHHHIVFAKYTPRLREWRKIVHSWMGRHTIKNLVPVQDQGIARLLEALLDDPKDFSDHFRTSVGPLLVILCCSSSDSRYTGGTLLSLIYGIKYASKNDQHLKHSEYSASLTSEAVRPGRWLCDSFPWSAHSPL